jgi:hypothetical protein
MCCGVLRRLIRKAQGIDEDKNLSQRPADPNIFVRCPACGCPLERSCSPSTYVAYAKAAPHGGGKSPKKLVSCSRLVPGDEDSERTGQTVKFRSEECERSGQTVKFREDVSEVSVAINSVV